MDYPHRNFPPLGTRHLQDAKLFAHREELIKSMRFLDGAVIAEVGVAQGNFSEFLLENLKPKRFVAFDTFKNRSEKMLNRWSRL